MIYGEAIRFLHDMLVMAQKERPSREKVVDGEPEWVYFERDVMLMAMQDICPQGTIITMKEVVRAETSALGHCDYTRQFAVNCAKIMFGISEFFPK